MFSLEPGEAITAVTGLVTIVGAYFAVKFGQKENHRLLLAVHKRLDSIVKDVTDMQINYARLDERVNNLRQTGRFRPIPVTETPMFKDEE